MDGLKKYDSILLSNWRKCDLLPLSLLLYYHTEHLTKCKNITNIRTLRPANYVYCKSLIFSKNVTNCSEYRLEKKLLPLFILFEKFCYPYEARTLECFGEPFLELPIIRHYFWLVITLLIG